MLFSMTGFGRGSHKFARKTINVEIRSLNSKGLDVRVRSNLSLGDKEMSLRKIISQTLHRGKIDVNIDVQYLDQSPEHSINIPLFKQYHQTLKAVTDELGMQNADLLTAILRIPNVVEPTNETITDQEWKDIQMVFDEASAALIAFRKNEGDSIQLDFQKGATAIASLLTTVEPFEAHRIERLKVRLTKQLSDFTGVDGVDANRFEQELIYFLDKIDISEEKTRLAQHCEHFLTKLNENGARKGRVLSFIAQEMGREINTLGSKANSADIQVLVVKMKEELEKIKEQVLNTL